MVDFNNKIVLITGGTSGIGKETVKGLLRLGAKVFSTARDMETAGIVAEEISREIDGAKIEFVFCDLSSLDSVREFVKSFTEKHQHIDVLINNAGVMPVEFQESKDGIELNWAVNFLAPFLMTNLLLPTLKNSSPARIINVASTLHKEGEIDFSDLESRANFDRYRAYGNSKLALILWTKYLAEKLIGTGVTVNALHPGIVRTKLSEGSLSKSNPVVRGVFKMTMDTPKEGAETSIYLATSPEVDGVTGKYFVKKKEASTDAKADDMEVAEKIVSAASDYVGLGGV